MSLWNKSGTKPKNLTDAEKRNVIATKNGWTRRYNYTDVHGNARVKETELVAMGALPTDASFGAPHISSMYVANTTGGTLLKKNRLNYLYVVYDEALSIGATASPMRITIANTAGGNTVIATSNTAKASIVNANNTLTFKFKGPATAGTYKVQAQTVANTAQHKVYSVISGTSETARQIISGTVSNTLSTFTIL